MEKIKLLVVDDIAQTRKDIVRLLYFEDDMQVVAEAADGNEALKKIAELQPDVVLMDINMPHMDGITATERACQLYPHVAVVIISIQGESEYLKKAMVAGAREYLVKPLSSDEMAVTIRSVYKQQKLRGGHSYELEPLPAVIKQERVAPAAVDTVQPITVAPGANVPSAPLISPPPATNTTSTVTAAVKQSIQTEQPLGNVTLVFSGKGGIGKTTIAANLAVVLAQNEKKKVALVDFDLQFGDISVMLNLNDGNNISDLVQATDTIGEEILADYLIRHFTGIDILPAPLFPQDAEYVTSEHTEMILQLLKKNYDYIVVDTAATFHEINLQAMEIADQILLVVTRDIAAIKNAKTSLNIMESLQYRNKIRVVLNRSDQDLGVEVADLEKGLEITVSHQVNGDEKSVISAINKGVPVVVSQPSADISKSLRRLGDRIANGRRVAKVE
ncbi:MAG: response regulator, partial [Firmicutes bacterium]|nr:response regulator [Bacillota bacterium]